MSNPRPKLIDEIRENAKSCPSHPAYVESEDELKMEEVFNDIARCLLFHTFEEDEQPFFHFFNIHNYHSDLGYIHKAIQVERGMIERGTPILNHKEMARVVQTLESNGLTVTVWETPEGVPPPGFTLTWSTT
jgi:hypothetical protein